jgi:hypothetical protein
MLTMLLCVGTVEAQVLVKGSVFGGGEGSLDDEKSGCVLGNSTVTMAGGTVERSLYGGGEQGSVGTFTTTTIIYPDTDPNENGGTTVDVPQTCASGGLTTVTISGGTVGRADQALMPAPGTPLLGDDFGYVFCGGRGEVDTTAHPKAIALGVVGSTSLNISGTALITASAYGGSENGMVLGNTTINMSGGQIGVGHYKDGGNHYFDGLYTDAEWAGAITAVNNATIGTSSYTNPFHECDSWPYGDASGNHYVYDVFADLTNPLYEAYATYALTQGASVNACDGHSFFGNLFGGGSGYYPYAPGKWRRSAGVVKGNVTINLSGGHVLTNLYAGNETTDILGKCTVNMSGGTIGVPRTLDSINKHPVTCYLYGGGMGDPRAYFDTWTKVNESEINITNGTIFGSVFGGGEEGHVLGNVTININEDIHGNTPLIGTLGYSYVDGNVFGGGRGLSGTSLTSGGVGGNVEINIVKGTMLGSIYGGGRLASVGTYFVDANNENYGQFQEGDDHGIVTINISGGTIGNNDPTDNALYHPHGGNVFGGSMGRLKDVNNVNYLELWPSLARVKETHVNIRGGTIKNVVYGGSEYGSVRDSAVVVINDPSIRIGKVYGGGYGSDIIDDGNNNDSTAYPALLAGRVEGHTLVKVKEGTIETCVYGGGDLATVGVVKNGNLLRGNSNVVIEGGSIGNATNYTQTTPNTEIGHVYGGGQGIQHDYEDYKAYCNVNGTNVTIKGGYVYGSVFGGGPDSHVLGNTSVTLQTGARIGTDGTSSWDGNVFGGGKGNTGSFTAGRVGGNTLIDMEDGVLYGNIYGGGRFGLTGVDEDGTMQNGDSHGNTKVMVKGGTVGNSTKIETFTDFSMGNIYGGGKGFLDYENPGVYAKAEPALLLGLTKNTEIEISNDLGKNTHVYGIVLGGGEIASVGKYTLTKSGNTITSIAVTEGKAKVTISGGTIGGDRSQMRYELAEPNNSSNWYSKYNDDLGYVYGGGEGWSDDPESYVEIQESASPVVTTRLVDLIATVQSTEVEVSGGWVKASVFGGSESGHVRGNTKVTISGGQIGAGYTRDGDDNIVDVLYTDPQFINPATTPVTTTPTDNTLSGTYRWAFGRVDGSGNTVYTPFDPAEIRNNYNIANQTYGYIPSDGKSWFGNVFGGGSGWFPYVTYNTTTNKYESHWNPLSGKVWGNTEVIITGGHILNNVYGANESTDVGGKATVRMSGGTVGVPRTREQVAQQPTASYLYGGGCGDPRPIFDGINIVDSTNVQITGGIIYGSVYGGAEDGHVLGDVRVTISQTDNDKTTVIGSTGTSGADGNLFGGGRNYLCSNYVAGRVGGNIIVKMSAGTLLGSFFGGGCNALTGADEDGIISTGENTFQALPDGDCGNITIRISGGTIGNLAKMRDCDYSIGDVYGGSRGTKTGITGRPAASALLVGLAKNTDLAISGDARIYGSVFGGGEVANVGNYSWTQTETEMSNIQLTSETVGEAKVAISGGTIGMDNMQMITTSGYPDDFGHVFGGGEGWVEELVPATVIDLEGNHLVELMATVGHTDVTISGTAFVLGSVYGGSMNGHVLNNTLVKIQGGQIGAGEGVVDGEGHNRPYTTEEWNNPYLAECAHWVYEEGGDPYDINIIDSETNKPKPGKNGATFFGNVFGGGSGYYPYGTDNNGNSQWLRSAGQVRGNTRVEVTGGHILTSLYGGCETTDVGTYTYNNEIHGEGYVSGGQSTVIMSGGTLGVPRTLAQIQAHPVTCYVFGSGKGDPRFYFNTWTNVWNAKVEIKGTAWVYGSVFGGGEEGHVLNNVDLDVSGNAKIGTLGYSYVDGNIFGGGRGFTGQALTAGTVGGNIDIDIAGTPTILGSVYGGGRLASVGTYLVDKQYEDPENPGTMVDNPYYGQFQDGNTHGHITIDITGGTIGNDHETATLSHANPYTYGGNVFGGCMGRFIAKEVGGETPIWPSLARAKQTEVTISDTALVKNSVFGGGEIGTVRDNATVNIEGGTIGGTYNGLNCGHVFGGGKGLDHAQNSFNTENDSTMAAGYLAGRVYGNTYVNISGGHIYENVFGGGLVASVGWVKNGNTPVNGLAKINVTGGEIGPLDMTGLNAYVFGGPKGGSNAAMKEYCNVNRTEVEVDYTDSDANRIWGSLFGGGSDGHVLGNATVTLKKGTVGTNGITGYDGNIFGGGRNYHEISLTAGRVGGNVTVDMQDGTLKGNIFGGGRQGLTGVDVNGNAVNDNTHGNITITVSGGIVGTTTPSATTGHVFGGGKGKSTSATDPHERFGETRSTHVTINGDALVNGNVFGGSENGQVLQNATVIIAGNATIGAAANDWQGRVYGGGRGIDKYESPSGSGTYVYSPTAGKVNGIASTTIKDNAIVSGSVLGGGEVGLVQGARIVNIEGGTVKRHVLGGNNTIPDVEGVESNGLMTVNVRGGAIEGSVFGGSYNALEGNLAGVWNSFVNVTGGTIGYATTDVTPSGNVYAAGYGGEVNGSVCLNVGLTAVKNAPTFNPETSTSANIHYKNGLNDAEPTPAKIKIEGNLFDGSYRYQATPGVNWIYQYDITGYSTMFIDGNGYNTADDNEASTTPYLNIFGGIYGGGNYCESGALGRKVLIKDYGTRNPGGDPTAPVTSVSRTLTTLQRSGIALIDNSNIHFTGEADLSQTYEDRDCFGILTVDDGFYVANGSCFVLGTDIRPAYMDSIKEIRSLHLKTGTSYEHINSIPNGWEWIGVNPETGEENTAANARLYYTETNTTTALTYAQENVMVFNGDSRMWVRYKNASTNGKVMYGPIYGFFRVRADEFTPNGTKSFAYARPKLTTRVNPLADYTAPINEGDGGFLSYNSTYNDFTKNGQIVLQFPYTTEGDDGGDNFTNTKQYPYYNFSEATTKGDMEEYREWVLPVVEGHIWYVDGRGIGNGGWGQDKSHKDGWGDYPDKPKQTITRNETDNYGIFYDPSMLSFLNPNTFNPAKDIIFVVGPIQASLEDVNLNPEATHSLKLYRYPGGHKMSNGSTDASTSSDPPNPNVPTSTDYAGLVTGVTLGPGANLGAMVNANKTTNFVMENVLVDGLYKETFTPEEQLMYTIPSTYNTEKLNVSEPLVVTASGAQLTLKGGTILQHGYNKTDASTTWFHNADYAPQTNVHHGALYVDKDATVNVEGLVTIEGNLQKNGSSTTECNVYLPTFDKYLNITGPLNASTQIGITSPIRNSNASYTNNTFSPVAVVASSEHAVDTATTAWRQNNFYDDQNWFFANEGKTTYYKRSESKTDNRTLYFGWTWANVVRKEPASGDLSGDVTNNFNISSIDSPYDLAWLISLVNGENGETASTLSDTDVKLTDEIDLQRYLWAPIGIESKPFSGNFDGQGHLISNLTIDYIGAGSGRYENTDFGMFGNVNNGTLDRTFLVGGRIQPMGNVNIGGLVGLMQGGSSVISNSEAAIDLYIPDRTSAAENASGGLVGLFQDGEIHSSMAMPIFHVDDYYTVGGLVGCIGTSSGSETPKLNNSFAYPKFLIASNTSPVICGGLAGINAATGSMKNCYARLQTGNSSYLTASNYGCLVHTNQGSVDYCFGFQGDNNTYSLAVTEGTITNSTYFTSVESSDTYGYLYADNTVTLSETTKPLFEMLNDNITSASVLNDGTLKYARWARPTITGINGDYPVLLLSNYDATNKIGQGGFRSMATYGGGPALQYGGPDRDGSGHELGTMLARSEDVYVYGDVLEDLTSVTINATKVAIHEDAAIITPGALTGYDNTYVGVSFDNSAKITYDVNGLARDWHMLSTPLQAAPLGIDYGSDNDGTSDPSYNPYTGAGDELPAYPFYEATEHDGYFPYNTPYAEYDFYCFNEYTKYNGGTIGSPHWINFKRNGNSHFYTQSWAPYNNGHIDYYAYDGGSPEATANVNDTNLIQGKGYLMALQEDTYLQSHGQLNGNDVTINISNKAVDADFGGEAQNLVGNPFHAYLDFYKFAKNKESEWSSVNNGLMGDAYYVYDADHGYYKSYTAGGSVGGDYANRYIHPHQGFFVKSMAEKGESKTITFNPHMLVTREEAINSDFRNDERPAYPLVNLYAEDYEGRKDVLVVEFMRPENGGGKKAYGLRSGNHMLYAHNGNDDYCAFFAKEGTEKVPVRFKTYQDGIFTMRWNTANGNFHSLYLIDNITGVTYDMLQNDSYTFNALESDYLSRFYIVFDVTDVEEFNENHIFAFYDGNNWVVNGTGFLQLIDVTGRIIYEERLRDEQNHINLRPYAKGVYLMRLTNHNIVKTQKIIH